jgi:hypothetical protein
MYVFISAAAATMTMMIVRMLRMTKTTKNSNPHKIQAYSYIFTS